MAAARPIVLLTDFGLDDFYAGVLHAVVAAGSPASRVFDLGHGIPAHDVAAASFVLALSFPHLPSDAVVVAVVDPGVGSARRGIVMEIEGRTLVGPDNGFASDLAAAGAAPRTHCLHEDAVARVLGARARGATFHGRDLFGPVAAAVARGVAVAELAEPSDHFVMLRDVPSLSIDGACVRGTGRYADRFGNVLTDIPAAAVRRVCPDGARVTVAGRDAGPLRRTYADGRPGELVAIVNAWDRIEAAVNGGRAIDRLGGGPPAAIRFDVRPE